MVNLLLSDDTNSTYEYNDCLDYVSNTNIYLSQDILQVLSVFIEHTTDYNRMIKMFIYMLNYAHHNPLSDECTIKLNSYEVSAILGYKNNSMTYPDSQKFIMKFKKFINSKNIRNELNADDKFISKGHFDRENKRIELTIYRNSPVIQNLISRSNKFVSFKFGALNESRSRHYVLLFLLLASRNKLGHTSYSVTNWKEILNISQKTTSTRVKKMLENNVKYLKKYFKPLKVRMVRKSGARVAVLRLTWNKYENRASTKEIETSIIDGGSSYINPDDNNMFMNNWTPYYSESFMDFAKDTIKYIETFCFKHKTHIINQDELLKELLKSYDKGQDEIKNKPSSDPFNFDNDKY